MSSISILHSEYVDEDVHISIFAPMGQMIPNYIVTTFLLRSALNIMPSGVELAKVETWVAQTPGARIEIINGYRAGYEELEAEAKRLGIKID